MKKFLYRERTLCIGLIVSTLLHIALFGSLFWSHYSRGVFLSIDEQNQECKNWCWAATSSMILSYYGKNVSQCEIVSAYTQQSCCIDDPCSNPFCNVPIANKDFPILFAAYGIPAGVYFKVLTEQELQNEIDQKRPLMINTTQSFFQNGHTVLLTGYLPPNENGNQETLYYLSEPDPNLPDLLVPYSQILVRYNPYRVWVSTLVTIPPPSP